MVAFISLKKILLIKFFDVVSIETFVFVIFVKNGRLLMKIRLINEKYILI